MKKIKIIAFILPILAIAVFVALQSFQQKESIRPQQDNGFQPTYEWFTHPGGATSETDPANYTYAPSFDPEASGCEGDVSMCAVKAIRNTGTNKPYLDLNGSGTQVVSGSGNVDEILRRAN